jgi:hypothetical protein
MVGRRIEGSLVTVDFRKNAHAILRHLYWRLRWAFTPRPWRLKLGTDSDILVPKSGAGALIYYLGHSEPETASFVAI